MPHNTLENPIELTDAELDAVSGGVRGVRGANGANGVNGANGANGAAGITSYTFPPGWANFHLPQGVPAGISRWLFR